MNTTTLHKTLVFLYTAVNLHEKGKPKYFVEILDKFFKNPSLIVFIYVFSHRHMEIRHCPFQSFSLPYHLIPVVCFPPSTGTRHHSGFFRGVGGKGKAVFFV